MAGVAAVALPSALPDLDNTAVPRPWYEYCFNFKLGTDNSVPALHFRRSLTLSKLEQNGQDTNTKRPFQPKRSANRPVSLSWNKLCVSLCVKDCVFIKRRARFFFFL